MATVAETLELAKRCEAFAGKLAKAMENRDRLSVGSQAIVIAMLVTLDLPIFDAIPGALRAAAAKARGEQS